MPDETVIEDDEVVVEDGENAHITSPELREPNYDEAPAPVDTEDAESLDEVHGAAAYNRAVIGPEMNDPTIATPGTDGIPEPGPGPEDNEALDNATGGALSNAAESGTGWPEPPMADEFANRGELEARKNANIGIKTTFDLNAPGERVAVGEGDIYDPDGTGVPGITSSRGDEPGIPAGEPGSPAPQTDEEGNLVTGEDVEQIDSEYEPGDYTVAEVNEYIAEHPEEADSIYAKEESGKGRAGILG